METLAGTLNVLSIFTILFSLSGVALSCQSYTTFTKLQMPSGVTGPESAAFNLIGQGPYTTVRDGRILKWLSPALGFVDFAYTSPNRTKVLCDGTTDPDLGPVCGRPLALSFNYLTGTLYIVDVYFGLLSVGPLGGLATPLATSAEGLPFKFLTGVEVESLTGTVYFNEASTNFDIRFTGSPELRNDSTGRFMKYDPKTKQVTVLLRGLSGGGGSAVSSDLSYVLVPEFAAGRINKYWLRGPKANTAEILLSVAGNVTKIKRASIPGQFWVATQLIISQGSTTFFTVPQGLKIDGFGTVLQTVSFAVEFFNKTISVVQEQNRGLYVGSRGTDFIGKYTD